MNLIILISIFINILLVTEGANPSDGIRRLKNKVNSAVNDLTRYRNSLESNLKYKLSNLKINEMTNVNNAVNSAIDETRKAITAANTQGKNADHCFEPMRLRLRDASQAAFNSLDECANDQVLTLKPVEQNIETHVLNGKLLLSKLDLIMINCASGTPIQVQVCIAQKMPEANSSVNNYESTISQLKNTGDSISSSGITGAMRCFQTPMTTLYNNVSSARIASSTCIKNA
ncbi:uncharacterized protein LOC123265963 [Cotesia glomerata]|uniref:Venom protein n=1 Tax=Cotesia glomerata TaxID=32391 RepID=A0AAV7IXE6_COTGL|nr:uncharacterized protein LOC123265963 [Cotesia glomerata]KAH0560424.1 hypothetical protein KQX54_004440 [Cotesia glomerata]